MSYQTFSLPVIHQDLRQEETVLQIALALDSLSSTVNEIFSRIEKRIGVNKVKLEAINARSENARIKITQLMGSNKSTKVFSSAKYPVATNYQCYEAIFARGSQERKNKFSYQVSSKHQPLESKNLAEKLQFYHVKLGGKSQRKNLEVTPEEGLGCLPWDLGSVTSLLLFNTSENPYQRYIQIDPLGAISRTRQDLLEEQNALEAPPISISQRDQPERPLVDSYFYSPGLGDVPLIDVPLDLPDLPGVADDLRYSVDMGPVIAPSVSTTPSFPELPVVSDSPSLSAVESKAVQPPTPNPTASSSTSQPQQPSGFHIQLPVPTQLPSPQTVTAEFSVNMPTISTVPPPPPPPPPPPLQPPPPPPPPPPPSEPTRTVVDSSVVTPPKPAAGDARANLMEAIRQAGGSGKANLRSAKQLKIETRKRKQEEKTSGDTDFMADLHAKLSMRRKGISGANKTEVSVGSAMQRVSAMIPPPQIPDPSGQGDGEEGMDEDWD